FMVDGDRVFGALSTRIEGRMDLTPAITADTRLSDLRGGQSNGITRGPIRIGNGTDSPVVDLSSADTIGDVVNAINGAGVGGITAAVAADGVSLQISGGAGENITVHEVGGGSTAADLGILTPPAGLGAGVAVN